MRSLEAELAALRHEKNSSLQNKEVKDTQKGLTGAEFAREIGVDQSTASRWKSGKMKTPENIAKQWEYRESDRLWYRKDHN